ncbi:PREDICTED: glutamate receptor ionotropic, kainate 2-like [Polistes dominula]|uniref:Glutamate receptor ionotropic, kainate 2-like n=1 Tax=Polistes dominula TaxID=743375 RepID=A0ABM1HYU7_POLDO|nr:PREDICTED: glutamate receptor ionotropic, kainate 2-like [Polistes dominula]
MLLICVILFLLPCIQGFPRRVPIGVLFDGDEMIERAFHLSIKNVNRNARISNDIKALTLRSEQIDTDTFDAAEKTCKLLEMGVAGLFGPKDKSASYFVQSMCDAMDLPYITTRWDPEQTRGNAINLYPHPEVLSMVYYNIIKDFNWKEYVILYDNTESLLRLQRVLELQEIVGYEIRIYHLGNGPNYRDILRTVKMSGVINIVIDCSYETLPVVLEQAQQVGLMLQKYNIIVTNLDLQTLDLEPYQYSGVNVTGVRMINPEDPYLLDIFNTPYLDWNLTNPMQLTVDAALAFDAVQIFARGMALLEDSVNGNFKKLACNESDNWEFGNSLSNFIRAENMHGLSGPVKFDTSGYRSDFKLEIVSLNIEGLNKVGDWYSTNSIRWVQKSGLPANEIKVLQDKHFIVLISLTYPYGMYKESPDLRTGNDRYEGFAVDIIDEMSKQLGFNYTFEVQEDNVYGSLQKTTGEWNGMIRKIRDGKADLAITDLTITSERESAVDFTTPFMNLGISVLYRQPTQAPPSWTSFLLPFSYEVWGCIFGAWIVVSLVLYINGRMSAAEWTNPYPCITEPEELETPYTMVDTPFFTIATLLNGASDFAPGGISTRAIGTTWWCFNLIINATYTANLAAALSTSPTVWPFTKADELPYQKEIKYGAKRDGSTISFFKTATYEPYKLMYDYMMEHASEVLTDNNEEGLKKVQQENYAFFMESTSIEYFTQRNCNVTKVGGLLDQKGYGIAMKKDIYYRNQLSGAILKLKESGIITELQDKWWRQKRGGDKCSEKPPAIANPLNYEDVSGVFIALGSGLAVSWIGTLWSFIWNIRNVSVTENVPFKEEFMSELKFLLKCGGTKIVTRRKKSSTTSTEDDTKKPSS